MARKSVNKSDTRVALTPSILNFWQCKSAAFENRQEQNSRATDQNAWNFVIF
jgi:hypothetical protein